MKKKSVQILILGLFVSMFLLLSLQGGIIPVAGKKGGTIEITATDDLPVGTPIIVSDPSSSGIALETAIVVDAGETELLTQYDEGIDELVFVLAAEIKAGATASFELTGESSGTSNGQTVKVKMAQGDYDATYDDWLPASQTGTFMNGSSLSKKVTAIGDVIWVDTDWGTLCLAVEADWRQGTWRHVWMKDELYDAVGTLNWNASSDGHFQWAASLFQDADEGWQRGGEWPDTIEFKNVGPVRAVIKTVANSDFKDLQGQSVQNMNATRTYSIYNGLVGIGQHFTLSGDNATQAMTDFTELNELEDALYMKHQMMDGRFGEARANNYTLVLIPGVGEKVARGSGPQEVNKFTDSYFAVYSNVTRQGYVYNWGLFKYKSDIDRFDPGNEIVIHYNFDAFPEDGLNRWYVPFSEPYNTSGSTIADYAEKLNTAWAAEYTTESKAAPAPGFELMFGIVALIGVSLFIRKRLRRN
jgi:hypothetical protein